MRPAELRFVQPPSTQAWHERGLRAVLDWRRFVARFTRGRSPVSDKNPILWEGDPSIYQATTVAGGHILEWAVRWRSNGYSLGDAAYTLSLAPRQTRRIIKMDWRRREAQFRRETTEQVDRVSQATESDRTYSDAVQSNLSEWSHGSSSSKATGYAGGIGYASNSFVVGGGGARGKSSSQSSQSGGRSVTASEQQRLQDAIRQYGDSLRRLESTVVTEVTQEESVEGVSEVVRNINYCHSLTVIYYEILRHLRVDTELAGVRECLFVPFSITPFSLDRALRWRDILAKGLRKPALRWAMDHLDDVADNFANSGIPPGQRADHRVTFVTGSLFMHLSLERPIGGESEDENTLIDRWRSYSWLFPYSVKDTIARLLGRDRAKREAWFQSEIAPTMAVRFANRLQLVVGGAPLRGVDFTLATRYRANQAIRVDFTYVPHEGTSLTRRMLENVLLKADPDSPLPPGSLANLISAEIQYYTEHFDRRVRESGSTTRDLIDIDTGDADPGAQMRFSLTTWELTDLRAEIRRSVTELVGHLNEHVEHYHKLIWFNMDRDRLWLLLDGFQLATEDGRSLASVVERDPVAIVGNALVFPVAAGAFLGINGIKSPRELLDDYRGADSASDPIRVSLPTGGVYARAIMDSCVACEEHEGSLDWVLTQKEPELEQLAPDILQSRRAEPQGTQPTPFTQPIINLQNAPAAPQPTGLGGVLQAVTTADAFRDMAGLAGTQANAMGALNQAAALATSFGSQAVDLRKAELATDKAEKKLAAVRRAQADGLIGPEQAQRITEQVLTGMNGSSGSAGPGQLTREPAVRDAIERASRSPGMPIEVRRDGVEGAEVVRLGGSAASTPEASGATLASSAASIPAATGSLASDPGGTIDVAKAVTNITAAMTAAPGGLCVEASLGVFREAMRAAGVPIVDSGVAGIEIPAIADPAGSLISGKAFVTIWYSNTNAAIWPRLPKSCRGAGAGGALLYADLVENRKLIIGNNGWPQGLRPGAFLQLWQDESAFLSVRDDAAAEVFGHSAIFERYVQGNPGQIVLTDQTGTRRTVEYPMYGCSYVIGANVEKGRVLVKV